MKNYTQHYSVLFSIVFMFSSVLQAQMKSDTMAQLAGHLWGLGFGDFSYKAKADLMKRGTTNQYTGMEKGQSLFQFRRLYLGYDNKISQKFSAEFLLAMEDNNNSTGQSNVTGDLLSNGRYGLFIKAANVTWNNIIKNQHLTLGQMFTPATVRSTEPIWGYRCIERTISEMRRTPAWDLGLRLDGTLHNNSSSELGYQIMIGNGTASKPENNKFKWFYANMYTRLFQKRITIDLYADYNRTNWSAQLHQERHMIKGMLAYSGNKLTVGIEAFTNFLKNDITAILSDSSSTYINSKALNYSLFVHGRVYRDVLGFFIRYDRFNPSIGIDHKQFIGYYPATINYVPITKEHFLSLGIDYTPHRNIHIMPNIWLMQYKDVGLPAENVGTDLIYRLSIYYVYGKN